MERQIRFRVTFREKLTHEVLDDTIFVIFAELAKFNKEPEECLTKQDQMLYILKNSGTFTEIYRPLWDNFDALESILEKMKIAGFDEIKRMQYEKDMYDERRRNGEIAAAFRISQSQSGCRTRGLCSGVTGFHWRI